MGSTCPIQCQAPKHLSPHAFISCVIPSFFLLAVPLYLRAKLVLEIISTCVTCCIMFSLYTKNAIACVFSEVIKCLMMLQQKQFMTHAFKCLSYTVSVVLSPVGSICLICQSLYTVTILILIAVYCLISGMNLFASSLMHYENNLCVFCFRKNYQVLSVLQW